MKEANKIKRCKKKPLTELDVPHRNAASTCPVLHDPQFLSSTEKLMYLPVSSCSGAVPPLNCASRDLWDSTVTLCTNSSVSPYSVYLNFGLDKTLVSLSSFSRWKRGQVTTYCSSLYVSPCITGALVLPGLQLKSAWLDLPCCLEPPSCRFWSTRWWGQAHYSHAEPRPKLRCFKAYLVTILLNNISGL